MFLVCPFDSLNPSGRAAAGIYHSWVWQSSGSHCPMQGGEGHFRRLLWRASELVSPQGKHAFKLWPACFPHGVYVHPDCSLCNSTNVFWVLQVCFALSLFNCVFLGIWFSEALTKDNIGLEQRMARDRVMPVNTRREFTLGWPGSCWKS